MILYAFTLNHDDIFQTLGETIQRSENLWWENVKKNND